LAIDFGAKRLTISRSCATIRHEWFAAGALVDEPPPTGNLGARQQIGPKKRRVSHSQNDHRDILAGELDRQQRISL